MSDIENQRKNELEWWNKTRISQGDYTVDLNYYDNNENKPSFEGNGDLYSENRMEFDKIISQSYVNKKLLDFGCGSGRWGIYYALKGAKEVIGFDMNDSGIKIGNKMAKKHNVQDKVKFVKGDATKLEFPDNYFDIVIGHGIIHHTIKYNGIFNNLHRVMKPGAKAYFLENLADFWIWKIWWKIKGEVPQGDVPIFSKEVNQKAKMFTKVEIIGDTLFHSIRTFIYKKDMGGFRRKILSISYKIDQYLFKFFPSIRKYGSFSTIILKK